MALDFCSSCGAAAADVARFCPNCGAEHAPVQAQNAAATRPGRRDRSRRNKIVLWSMAGIVALLLSGVTIGEFVETSQAEKNSVAVDGGPVKQSLTNQERCTGAVMAAASQFWSGANDDAVEQTLSFYGSDSREASAILAIVGSNEIGVVRARRGFVAGLNEAKPVAADYCAGVGSD